MMKPALENFLALEGDLFQNCKDNYIIYKKVPEHPRALLTPKHGCDPILASELNGIVIDTETKKIVCQSQNVIQQVDELPDDLESGVYCEDGTVIRLYYDQDRWNTATNKCPDARQSFWSTVSFDELFWGIFNYDLALLDKAVTYIFILLHKENRIVVKQKENKLIYVKGINNETGDTSDILEGFERLKVLTDLSGVPGKRGILFKKGNVEYRYDFKEYKNSQEIIGNFKDPKERYLQLLYDQDLAEQFKIAFPEHKLLFSVIDQQLEKLYEIVRQAYIDTHLENKYKIFHSHKLHKILKKVHYHYKNSKTDVTIPFVTGILLTSPEEIPALLDWHK